MTKVLITDRAWPDLDIERAVIEGAGFELVAGPATALPAPEIARLAAEHRPAAIMTCWAEVNAEAMRACPHLRIVARIGVGLDNIDRAAAAAIRAVVTNVPDYCVEEVSDHAVGLLLDSARGITSFDRAVKAGRWDPALAELRRVRDLVVGIAGFGRIGRRTAHKLAAFGVKLLVFDMVPVGATAVAVEQVELAELVERSDVVVIHLPLTPSTHHLFDAGLIGRMKPGGVLINVSRGGLVDNAALLDALDRGAIAMAGLDVIEGEPTPPEAITRHPRVIATPHIAFSSTASLIELRRRAAEEVVRVLRGEAPHHPCPPP
ncbi:MAG: C-terminal binding protein [Xanthobacteraceae bacterium]